jgi:hypothetical protein
LHKNIIFYGQATYWPLPLLQYARQDIIKAVGQEDVNDGYRFQPIAKILWENANEKGSAGFVY